jgi:LmbE family N-acetylglucosaminyl deacetylase
MVTFDARDAGTTAAEWDAADRLQRLPLLRWDRYRGVLVVVAHPDDETLGAGGILHLASDRGLPVRVVVATDGSPTGDRIVAHTRRAELRDALALLAPDAELLVWDYPDARTGEHRDALRADIAAMLAQTPGDWLVIAPWPGDGHHDHRVIGELVAELADGRAVAHVPIWMWQWATPDDERVPWSRMTTVAVDADLKRRAIACYPSQTTGPEPMLRPEMLAHFERGQEVFVVDALPEEYFDETYARHDDPWGFLDRWYERRKRAVTLASLPRERYGRVLEVGCSIGVLTADLADRADDLLAVDVSAAAVARAAARLGDRARVQRLDIRDGLPPGEFDLIVVSEVGYYLTREPLRRLLEAARSALAADGELLCCHWRHPVRDYPLTGDDVARETRELGLPLVAEHRERDFVLQVYARDPRSVAERTGLA